MARYINTRDMHAWGTYEYYSDLESLSLSHTSKKRYTSYVIYTDNETYFERQTIDVPQTMASVTVAGEM